MEEQVGVAGLIWPSATAAVVFGFSFLFTKAALDSLDMFQLLGSRFLVAALLECSETY